MGDQSKVAVVKEQYEKEWLAINGVAGIGIGKVDERMGIIISVIDDVEIIRKKIPSEIEGVPIEIKQTGAFNAQ